MTREEAIKVIRKMLACTDLSVRANLTADMVDACHMAIKALEREPCCNCIEFKRYLKEMGFEIEQEPILDKVKQAREEIENEVKFWSEPSKYNEESLAYVRKAKARSYKHCLEILDKLIESEEV